MLIVETVVRIRREHAAGKAIKAIARDLRLSRKVVRKAIRSPEATFNYQRKVQPLPRIGPYQDRQIGRAPCREGVCQYVEIPVVAVSLKKKQEQKIHTN